MGKYKLSQKEKMRYNIWLDDVSRDPDYKVLFLRKVQPIGDVRKFMGTMLAGAGVFLLATYFVGSNVSGWEGGMRTFWTVITVLLLLLAITSGVLELHAANFLIKTFKEEQDELAKESIVEDVEYIDELDELKPEKTEEELDRELRESLIQAKKAKEKKLGHKVWKFLWH